MGATAAAVSSAISSGAYLVGTLSNRNITISGTAGEIKYVAARHTDDDGTEYYSPWSDVIGVKIDGT